MKLSEYLNQNNLTARGFAAACDVHEGTIRRCVNEGKPPNLRTAMTISSKTLGVVTLRDLLGDDFDASTVDGARV